MSHNWNYKNSIRYYNINKWGNSYFSINAKGQITVKKTKTSASEVPLVEIVDHIKTMGLKLPVLLRFPSILSDRVKRINRAFYESIKKNDYTGNYKLIYPIKVNQNITVVKKIFDSGCGLEAGSKAELYAIFSVVDNNYTPIICNGYKDYDYIKTALIMQKIGRNVSIIIDKSYEVDLVIKVCKEINIKPKLGIRVRLAITFSGRWENSGGLFSKFGLTNYQLTKTIQTLKDNNLLDCLQLLHCHQGSQLSNINNIDRYLDELSNIYASLLKIGAPIKIIDIGGGLAIDYEGNKSSMHNSANYSLKNYADSIVLSIKKNLCSMNINQMPDIYTESGRAVTAHHALCITNIIDIEDKYSDSALVYEKSDSDFGELHNIFLQFNDINLFEIYSNTQNAIAKIKSKFDKKEISFDKLAIAEHLSFKIKKKIYHKINAGYKAHRDLFDILQKELSIKIIVNLSIFQSLPDSWAISQLFPILPITSLNNHPTDNFILDDLTCDSDGVINQYSTCEGLAQSIKFPRIDSDNPYLIGFFLLGAYQETMGNLHNLFFPVTNVEVLLEKDNKFSISNVKNVCGVLDSLESFNYNTVQVKENIFKYVKNSNIESNLKTELAKYLQTTLSSSSYLKDKSED